MIPLKIEFGFEGYHPLYIGFGKKIGLVDFVLKYYYPLNCTHLAQPLNNKKLGYISSYNFWREKDIYE